MAQKIVSLEGRLDKFEVKCPYCGVTISYSRKDIRAHRRWPNGFIFCANCRRPIGHDEANFVNVGEDIGKIMSEDEQIQVIQREINSLRTPKSLLLGFGIPLLVISAVVLVFTSAFLFSGFSNAYLTPVIISATTFIMSLAMVIVGRILRNKIFYKSLKIEERIKEISNSKS